MTERDMRSDRRAERALLTRARRGDIEALRGLLHRYASVVWAICALTGADEQEAAHRFSTCWGRILSSLGTSRRSPDMLGMLVGHCRAELAKVVPEARLEKAVASAQHLAADEQQAIEVPAAAVISVAETLPGHSARLQRETQERRSRRRRHTIAVSGILIAVAIGLGVARRATSRPSDRDTAVRCVRLRIIKGDVVPRFRDCVSPPFAVADRAPAEAQAFEQIALVLEELSNAAPGLRAGQVAHLKRRVKRLGLVDFAFEQAERERGSTRKLLQQVGLILEEIANL